MSTNSLKIDDSELIESQKQRKNQAHLQSSASSSFIPSNFQSERQSLITNHNRQLSNSKCPVLQELDKKFKNTIENLSGNSSIDSKLSISQQIQKATPNLFQRLHKIYPTGLVAAITIQYLNAGLKVMFGLAIQDLFKNYYKIEPSESQVLISSIDSPWFMKIFFGIFIDGFQKYISKRTYFIICGILQCASLLIVSFKHFDSEYTATIFLAVCSFSGAFADVVVNALIVEYARLDTFNGSQDLQSLCWIMYGVGGTIGTIFSAFATQYCTPSYVFTFYSLMGLLTCFTGFFIKKKQEMDQNKNKLSFCQDLKYKCSAVWINTKEPIVYKFYIYILLSGLAPGFGEYGYYFMQDVLNVDQFIISMLSLGAIISVVFAILIYQYFKHYEVRTLFFIACMINLISDLLELMLAKRWNIAIGIPDALLFWTTEVGLGQLTFAFTQLPAQVIFTQINPPKIEAFLVSVQGTIFSLSQFLLGGLTAVAINQEFVGVTTQQLDKYWILCVIGAVCSVWPLLWLFLVPKIEQTQRYQKKIIDQDDKLQQDQDLISQNSQQNEK